MKIISIEGLDKAGKHTATNVLFDFFKSKGLKVKRFSLPNYESPIGKLIQDWLNGTFHANPQVFELLQAADKQQMQDVVQAYEKAGIDILLIDRYLHSQWAYGAYDNDEEWLQALTKYMRKPDAVIFLDVEPEVSLHRKGKFGNNDRYEADLDRLRYTQDEYNCLFEEQRDTIDIKRIDANQPPLIVKAQVLQTALHLYEAYTGKKLEDKNVLDFVTKDEADMIRLWCAPLLH